LINLREIVKDKSKILNSFYLFSFDSSMLVVFDVAPSGQHAFASLWRSIGRAWIARIPAGNCKKRNKDQYDTVSKHKHLWIYKTRIG